MISETKLSAQQPQEIALLRERIKLRQAKNTKRRAHPLPTILTLAINQEQKVAVKLLRPNFADKIASDSFSSRAFLTVTQRRTCWYLIHDFQRIAQRISTSSASGQALMIERKVRYGTHNEGDGRFEKLIDSGRATCKR